jgi:hypothetical protein
MLTSVLLVHHYSSNKFLNNYLNNITSNCVNKHFGKYNVCESGSGRGENMAVTRLKPTNLITS